jgi:KUP system potassium uptake protein
MLDRSSRTGRVPGAAETAALGIVFGDIGTSPLYALRQSAVAAGGTGGPGQAELLGVLSLVFWTITVVVTLKYVLLVLRADHEGEGGILALLTLLRPRRGDPAGRILILIGLVGAATLFGDGVLTPAISVLSAVEGLEVVAPNIAWLSLPIAVAILAGLFSVQRFGTAPIARYFGPVMLIWFGVIGAFGAAEIVREPQVLAAVDPRHGLALLLGHPASAAPIVGAVFLAVTGGEALYADLGQFGRPVIQRAWFAVALPALLFNYFGQGALLLHRPEAIGNPFFALVPSPFGMPAVILATLATIIASQAIITGAFSLAKQATELGYIPPMRIRYTSPENEREIYIGPVNATLAGCTIAIAVAFGSSASLASAYGIAVSITMVATTVLFFAKVCRSSTRAVPWMAALPAVLLVVDLGFVGANLTKVADGGWLPLGFGAAVLLVMLSWRQGLDELAAYQKQQALSLETFAAEVKARLTHRTAIFLTRTEDVAPSALVLLRDLAGIRFTTTVVVSVGISDRPRVPPSERVRLTKIDRRITKIRLDFGYMQDVRLPAVITPVLREAGIDTDEATYIVGHQRMIPPEPVRALSDALAHVAAFLARNAERDVDRFALPYGRTVILGQSVKI